MKSHSKHPLRRALSLLLMCAMVLSLLPAVAFAAGERAAGQRTYYVSITGKGGNNGLSEAEPLPGLDAIPWDQLLPGDSVLLKKGDTFPGIIRVVDVHGTADAPITIGTYGTGAAPVIEARGQGIWLPETGSRANFGKYTSSGVLLYDCSYVTVTGLNIVNRPEELKTSYIDIAHQHPSAGVNNYTAADRSSDKLAYSGVAVAADGVGAAEGIVLTDITVHGDADTVAVITDTSTSISTTGVTLGTVAPARTFTNASGTYYVSSLSGSDANDGSSPDKAFYSLHKINELNLKAGAKVYLERGSVFENQYLHIEGGGADGNPIIVDAYGASNAPKPLINTNGNGVWYQNYRYQLDNTGHLTHGYVSSSILLYDVPYIEVKNIAMTNGGHYGETPGADFENLGSYDGGAVPGETGYNTNGNVIGSYTWGGKMCRTGVGGVAQNKGTVHHTVLQNLDIENVFGQIAHKHMDNGGIYFTAARPLDEAATGIARFDDLRIEGCYLNHVSRWGIAAVHSTYWCEISPNTMSVVPDEACRTYGATNVYVGHNFLNEVGGDPITLMHAYEPLVEYNVSQNGGREMDGVSGSKTRYMNGSYPNGKGDVSAGIWPWKCKTAVFEHNECYTMLYARVDDGNGGTGVGNNDCQAWDADYGDSTIYQYNYSAGNTGGSIMFCAGHAYNTVFRYNVSYKDGMPNNDRGVMDITANPNGQVMNNTFIMAEGTLVHRMDHSGPAYVQNNIFYNLGEPYDPHWHSSTYPGTDDNGNPITVTKNYNLNYNNNIYSGFDGYPNNDPKGQEVAKSALFADTTFAGAPEAPKSTSKDGVRMVNGVRDWSRDWATEFNMFKLKDNASAAINAGMPYSYTGLTQDSDFGVPRAANDKDFYGNVLDDVHDIGAHDTLTPGGGSACELVSSLYELRNTTELQVPFTANNPMSVEDFAKGLTVSEGATVKVYNGTTEVTSGNVAADMTVKIVAADGKNETVYTIKNKNTYNHSSDWINNQQGNVWFCQYRLLADNQFYNWSGWTSYGSGGWYEGSNHATAEPDLAGDDLASNPADRKYIGSGFTFRAPQTGKVTVSFATQPKFRTDRATSKDNQFDTYMIIYRNGVQIDGQKTLVPKAVEGETSRATANISDFTLTVVQGDTIEFMVVNEGDTRSFSSNNNGVTFNPVVTYTDEEVTETPADTKAPSTPSGLSAKNITADSATLSWVASSDNVGVDHYVITVGDDEYTTTDLTYALTDLEENTEYTVTVKAVDAAENESGEASVTFHTAKAVVLDTQAPTVPSGGKTVSAKSKSVTIAWDASTDNVGVDHYEVTVNGKTETVRNITQITVSDLTPGTQYTASVKAVDAAGNASAAYTFNFSTAARDTTPPSKPAGLCVPQVSKTIASVRWEPSTDNEGVMGYKVKLGADGEVQDVGDLLTYTITGLEGFTEYTAYVCAYDEAGNESVWATVDFQTTGSSECELISTLFEISGGELKIPYTEQNPLTLEEFRAAFQVSEDAKVKVYQGDTEVTSGNVTADMTVKIVAQDGTVNSTTYTTAQKSSYNSYEDWGDGSQGNVWFYQYDNGTEVVNHTRKESWGWGGENPDYRSVERNQACGDVTAEKGSGFTFRAPADGNVTIQIFCYPVKESTNHTENAVQKRDDTSSTSANNSNTLQPYLAYFLNGQKVESKNVTLAKDTSVQTVNPVTCSLAQGDELSVFICNGGPYDNSKGNNGLYFNPVITYNDEVYTPLPKSIELSESDVTLFTNTSDQEKLPHTIQLTATVLPAAADQTVTWHSNDEEVATVGQNGLVTAVGDGTTNISATVNKGWGSFTANCTVRVRTRMESIKVKNDDEVINDKTIKLYVNEGMEGYPHSVTLTTETTPPNPTHPQLNWAQSEGSEDKISLTPSGTNGSSVTITASGKEVNVGEATVSVASAEHKEVSSSFKVHVIRLLDNPIHVTGDAKVGSTLTVSTVDLVMTNEGKDKLSYQWYLDSVSEENKIDGAIGKQYVVTADDIGHKLVVTATADPETFYEGKCEAQTDQAVAKMAGPAAPTGLTAVNCTDGDNGQITGLDSTKVYEYKLATDGDDDWTETAEGATTINNLPAGNYQVRIKAETTQEDGKAATVTIMAANVTAYTITADTVEGGTIDISASQAKEDTEITLTITPDTGYELVENSLEVTYTDENGDEQTVDVTDGVFEMPAGNVTITAQFKKKSFTITHDMENVTCSLPGEDVHTVEYGETPNIKLTAKDGYTMPSNMQVTYVDEEDNTQPFYGYEYSRSATDPDTATLKFTSGITADLTVTAVIPVKTFAVRYDITDGLSAPADHAPRKVDYKAAYTGTLVADDPTAFKLPQGITITMAGVTFTGFTYDSETGDFVIAEGKITGDLVITASGVDATVPVVPVTGVKIQKTVTVEIGKSQTLTFAVLPEKATDPRVILTSADPDIATVDNDGKVVGVAEGDTTITITTVDGNCTDICNVKVIKPVTTTSSTTRPSTTTTTEVKEDGTKVTTETKPDGTKVETVETPDGTTAVTETKKDGTVIEKVETPDGTKSETETKPDGSKTATVEQADGTKSETVVTPEGDATITVTDAEGEELVKTEIPATIPAPETKFEDLDKTPWAEEAINKVAGLELVKGVGGNKYDPVTPMTRGALATVLHRLSNGKTDYQVAFKDVQSNKYYTEGVAWAAKVNVVKGISEDIFAPDQIITREQLAVMLCRYAKLIGMSTKADAKSLEQFTDGDTTGAWAVDGMAWCVEKGILKGKGLNNLDPTADVSRAEVAVMLDRFIALIQK